MKFIDTLASGLPDLELINVEGAMSNRAGQKKFFLEIQKSRGPNHCL